MNTKVGCSYPACVMFFVIRYPSRSYRVSRCGSCNRTPSRTPAAPVLRARCSTLSRSAVPIPLRRKCGRTGEAPEIQKSVDGFVESEPHRKSPAMAMSAPPRESRLRTVSTVSSCAPEGGSRNPSYSANAARSRSRIAAASGRAASLTVIPPNLFNFQPFDVESNRGNR